MKTIVIENIPLAMWQHIVNGFGGSGTAFATLSEAEQTQLVCSRLFEYAASVAKAHAVNAAQIAAMRATSSAADAMIEATKEAVQFQVQEVQP